GETHTDLIAEKWDGDLDELREPAGAVDPRGLIEGQVELRHACEQQDGAEPQQNPDPDKAYRRKRPVEVPKPGTRDHAESDGPEDLVDQAWEGQQPAPDDSGCSGREERGREQSSPGHRSEPPGRHAVHHVRGHETERHWDEAEEHD